MQKLIDLLNWLTFKNSCVVLTKIGNCRVVLRADDHSDTTNHESTRINQPIDRNLTGASLMSI